MKLQSAAFLVFITLASALAGYSQTFAGAKVAMIDTDAFSDEKSGITKLVNAYKALDIEFKPMQDDLDATKARYDNIAKEVQQLQEKLNSPPKGVPFDMNAARTALTSKVDDGQRLEIDLKRKQEDAKAKYEKRSKVVVGPISADIGKAMNVFAAAHGIDLILDTSKLADAGALLFLGAAADVTEAFIKEYNTKNAGVPVKKLSMMEFTGLIDLASEKLGGAVLFANDDFFAQKENLLKPAAPVWKEGLYTDLGKWMDGWETRRRRSPRLDETYDWCVIRLGMPGEIKGIVVDTAFFRGNYPSHCLLEACTVDGQPDIAQLLSAEIHWKEILPLSELQGDSQNKFAIEHTGRVTHLRFKIYPDGGVARLRVHGNVLPDWDALRKRDSEIDLAAAENGGDVPLASDMFFGHRHNLIMPGLARDMSDGWESQRRRGPGHDWCIVKLGTKGTITRVEIDTSHFKGNYPESGLLEGGQSNGDGLDSIEWRELLPMSQLQAHTRHTFEAELADLGGITHVRFSIFPDGGVSRLRLFGRIAE